MLLQDVGGVGGQEEFEANPLHLITPPLRVWIGLKCLIYIPFYNPQTIQRQIVDSGYSQTMSSCGTREQFGETCHLRIAWFE